MEAKLSVRMQLVVLAGATLLSWAVLVGATEALLRLF
jgi:hypothetical protein